MFVGVSLGIFQDIALTEYLSVNAIVGSPPWIPRG